MKYAAIAALIAVVSAKAPASNCLKGMKTTFYTDKKCETVDEDKAAVEATDKELEAFDGTCKKVGEGSSKVKCTDEGIETTVYETADCKGDGVAVTVKWTHCFTVTKDK